MHAYSEAAGGDWRRPSLRQRAVVLALTLLVELAVLLLVLAFGGNRVRELVAPMSPISITFLPNPAPTPAPRVQQRADKPARPSPPKRPQPPRPMPPAAPHAALPYIPISRLELAASDISKLGSAGGAPAASGPSTRPSAAVGEGPGGVTLYNAEWVREPSDAELRTYLPRAVEPGSWALIACQTIAHYHVENCAQLSEGPRGSGLSKAMRLAAWQFLVRPPRIDGKPMVGSWVRIRIDFGKAKGEE